MDYVKKSLKVIKESQLDNGGILAGTKKSAYPYIYPRDAVIITKALNVMGEYKRSEKFYYFMKKFAKIDHYQEVFHRYNSNGWPCVTRKNENDNEGLLLHGIYNTYLASSQGGQVFLENMWPLVEEIVSLIKGYCKSGLLRTERSIHEFYRLEKGHEIWANCAGWRGLKDAAEIAKVLEHEKEAVDWGNFADKLGVSIKKKLFNKKLGVFVKRPEIPNTPDISQLAPFYFGLVNDKKMLRRTMDYLRKHLWNDELGGFRRFRKFDFVEDWHWYTGGSGSWCVLTAWAARFYREIGDKKKYEECLEWLNKIASKTGGLLPEHIATREEYDDWKVHEIEFNQRLIDGTRVAEKMAEIFKKDKENLIYWGTPLGWSHAEYILLHKGEVTKKK
jgi:GH15 family glucan-1,4-alpha-glucosidase